MTREDIRIGIQLHVDVFRACYESQLVGAPDLAGRLVVELVVEPDGHVSSATPRTRAMTPEGPAADAVQGCVLDAVGAVRFPPPIDGRVRVSYPFLFAPGR